MYIGSTYARSPSPWEQFGIVRQVQQQAVAHPHAKPSKGHGMRPPHPHHHQRFARFRKQRFFALSAATVVLALMQFVLHMQHPRPGSGNTLLTQATKPAGSAAGERRFYTWRYVLICHVI